MSEEPQAQAEKWVWSLQCQQHEAGQTDMCLWALPEGLYRAWGVQGLCLAPHHSPGEMAVPCCWAELWSTGGFLWTAVLSAEMRDSHQHCLLFSAAATLSFHLLCKSKLWVSALKTSVLVGLALSKLLKMSIRAAGCIFHEFMFMCRINAGCWLQQHVDLTGNLSRLSVYYSFFAGIVGKKWLIHLLGELNTDKWLNSVGNERPFG